MYTEFTNWHFSLMANYNGDWLNAFDVLLSAYQVSCSVTWAWALLAHATKLDCNYNLHIGKFSCEKF